jgi:hypothetical protein
MLFFELKAPNIRGYISKISTKSYEKRYRSGILPVERLGRKQCFTM